MFVNRYFHPDHSATSMLLGDLAFALSRAGEFDVSVITSRQRYDDAWQSLPPTDQVIGVKIWRVGGTRFGRQRLLARAVDYLSFHLASAWFVLRRCTSGDVIVAKTDPPLLSLSVGLAAALRGARRVNWIQDLFPEIASELGVQPLPSAAYGVLLRLRDRSLRGADANVVIGDRMAERLRQRAIQADRVAVIPNWVDSGWVRPVPAELNRKRAEWGLAGRFVVQYAGNLGRVHDVDTMLEAIKRLARIAPRVVFLFVGGGAQRGALESAVRLEGLSNVVFKPYQPRSELAETLSVGDVHLVTLVPRLEGLVVPSKFYGVCSVGRPTIHVGDPDGEIGRIVARERIGFTVAEGDSDGLARAIVALESDAGLSAQFAHNARALAVEQLDKSIGVRRFTELLRGLGSGAGAGGLQAR